MDLVDVQVPPKTRIVDILGKLPTSWTKIRSGTRRSRFKPSKFWIWKHAYAVLHRRLGVRNFELDTSWTGQDGPILT
jgi:hypothetical protein